MRITEALEARGIPRLLTSYRGWDFDEVHQMDTPPDLGIALAEMERKEVITIDEFRKEFKQWDERIIRMNGCKMMVFTHHFVSQLHEVLSYYDGPKDFSCPGSALYDVLRWDLRSIAKSPIKKSYPTTNPKIRYVNPFCINVTFHFDLEALTVLSICTEDYK